WSLVDDFQQYDTENPPGYPLRDASASDVEPFLFIWWPEHFQGDANQGLGLTWYFETIAPQGMISWVEIPIPAIELKATGTVYFRLWFDGDEPLTVGLSDLETVESWEGLNTMLQYTDWRPGGHFDMRS